MINFIFIIVVLFVLFVLTWLFHCLNLFDNLFLISENMNGYPLFKRILIISKFPYILFVLLHSHKNKEFSVHLNS